MAESERIEKQNNFFKRRLEALNYHNRANFSISDFKQIQELVAWLERTQIRAWKKHQREGLKKESKKEWMKHFTKYLKSEELDYPGAEELPQANDFDDDTFVEVIDFLVNKAVMLKYQDQRDTYNVREPKRKKAARMFTSCDSSEYEKSLETLCGLLRIPPGPNAVVTTRAIHDIMTTKFKPAAIASFKEWQASGVKDPCMNLSTPTSILRAYPDILDFDTDDTLVNAAATILRMMYIKDLRETQTQLNMVISELQDYTANPKTNSNLGKVGRH